VHTNRRGLDLPISGTPEQTLDAAASSRRVALIGADYVGMKPTMHVRAGDVVSRGQLLFEDKKTPGVRFTAPGEGKVSAVNRGDKRAFQSVVIELSAAEMAGGGEDTTFRSYLGRAAGALSADQVRDLLLESGQWTALRARPFGRVADPQVRPHSIFVTVLDSNPLAPSVGAMLEGQSDNLRAGLEALLQLTDGNVWVCAGPADQLDNLPQDPRLRIERFRGPHPAGTAGWHIHRLDPVDRHKTVWHLGLQDAVATGHLFRTGRLLLDRVVSLAGPGVRRPRLVRTRLGASVDDLVAGELLDGEMRVISGSVLSGRAIAGPIDGFLGRYHQQISALAESRERRFLGWMGPGLSKFSVLNAFVSRLIPGRRFAMTTSTHGSPRSIVPIGAYERVFPFDIPASYLLRSLAVGDLEKSEEFGCLELEDEDLALCTFVDPGKNEFGPYLREVLTTLEKEG